jgi:hypothetical protein
LVVDSSDGQDTRQVVSRYVASTSPGQIQYLAAAPGLTTQRNIGLDALAGFRGIVHFIDDDSRVSPDYFVELSHEYADPRVVGVGGLVVEPSWEAAPRTPRYAHLYRRLFLIEAAPGGVTKSARNSMLRRTARVVSVSWLSGCSMSFRYDLALREKFDEGLRGYSLGEDLEFSTRMARHGLLRLTPHAVVEHLASPTNRSGLLELTVLDLVNRWYFVGKLREFNRLAFWWTWMGMVIEASGRTLLGRGGPSGVQLRGLLLGAKKLAVTRT